MQDGVRACSSYSTFLPSSIRSETASVAALSSSRSFSDSSGEAGSSWAFGSSISLLGLREPLREPGCEPEVAPTREPPAAGAAEGDGALVGALLVVILLCAMAISSWTCAWV